MTSRTGFLAGKKLLITGVLSNRSIAYGIAKACHSQGAELAFSYVGERFKDRITEFAMDFDSKLIFDCDVGDAHKLTICSKICLPIGLPLTALCTVLAMHPGKPLREISLMALAAKLSKLHMTSAPTVSPQ